jgi:hypothetical protein
VVAVRRVFALCVALLVPAPRLFSAPSRNLDLSCSSLFFPLYKPSPALAPRRQVVGPVMWEKSLKTLLDKGLTSSYEVGPGKVISGIMKRVDKAHAIENITA